MCCIVCSLPPNDCPPWDIGFNDLVNWKDSVGILYISPRFAFPRRTYDKGRGILGRRREVENPSSGWLDGFCVRERLAHSMQYMRASFWSSVHVHVAYHFTDGGVVNI
jgi:hypothetical protein